MSASNPMQVYLLLSLVSSPIPTYLLLRHISSYLLCLVLSWHISHSDIPRHISYSDVAQHTSYSDVSPLIPFIEPNTNTCPVIQSTQVYFLCSIKSWAVTILCPELCGHMFSIPSYLDLCLAIPIQTYLLLSRVSSPIPTYLLFKPISSISYSNLSCPIYFINSNSDTCVVFISSPVYFLCGIESRAVACPASWPTQTYVQYLGLCWLMFDNKTEVEKNVYILCFTIE